MPKLYQPGRYRVQIVRSQWREHRDAEKLVMDLEIIESLEGHDVPNAKYPPALWFSWHSEKLCNFNIDRLRAMGWTGEKLRETFPEDSLVGLTFIAEVQHRVDSDYDNWEVVMPAREKKEEKAVDKRRLSNLDRMLDKYCRSTAKGVPVPSDNGKLAAAIVDDSPGDDVPF